MHFYHAKCVDDWLIRYALLFFSLEIFFLDLLLVRLAWHLSNLDSKHLFLQPDFSNAFLKFKIQPNSFSLFISVFAKSTKSRSKLLFQPFFSCTISPPASSLVQASLSVNDFKGVSSHFLPYAFLEQKTKMIFANFKLKKRTLISQKGLS